MERHGVIYRNANKRAFNVGRTPCRQFIRGSCRFGASCHFSHELPVLPSAEICRYFQKGDCWFGDRCRYQHILQPGVRSSAGRWESASVAHGRAPLDRRGSEPSISQAQGAYSGARRGSEPLVTGMVAMQHGFDRLTMGITEEEEHTAAEASLRPCLQQGLWSQLQHSSQNIPPREGQHRSRAVPSTPTPGPGVSPAEAGMLAGDRRQDSGAGKPSFVKTSSQQGAGQDGAAAVSGNRWSEEAYQQSKDMMCGICMDKVYEKPRAQERRFGILPNCSHAFCLGCIVTWRKTKDFQDDVIKACPQCRVKSSYYIPSKFWVSEGEPKQALITAFKNTTSKIRCNFFLRNGCCPFKSECIYRHELPNGYRPRRRRSPPVTSTPSLEDLDSDSLQLLHYIIALALLDDDEVLDEDDYFQLYLAEDGGLD
ncbi:makorin, ring finger protein, 4 [Megalops cyprinoides]|uniref:makorin, ring finger protein, 4 n=1 Tax=Megalops cyprinoides TaxID=118141 RepID=UPI001864A7D8|nr:makorin, ring finger protein, 4 [Megalops cyprinoides]